MFQHGRLRTGLVVLFLIYPNLWEVFMASFITFCLGILWFIAVLYLLLILSKTKR